MNTQRGSMKFFLDPGHGGDETGAIGHDMTEKNINREVAIEVKRILTENGQQVMLSRESDATVTRPERCTMANNWDADYFISIHHNAYDGKKSGSEVYASIHGGKGLDFAHVLADIYRDSGRPVKVIQREGEKDPGTDYYDVIRLTRMPAVISEYGYMDSQDYISFDTELKRKNEAKLIAKACLQIAGYKFGR